MERMVKPFIQWGHKRETHVKGNFKKDNKTKLAVERMTRQLIQWNVWLNHSFNGAIDRKTHVDGCVKKAIGRN